MDKKTLALEMKNKHAGIKQEWEQDKTRTIQVLENGIWVDSWPEWADDCEYRLAPKTDSFRVALLNDGGLVLVTTQEEADQLENENNKFIRWITDWIEYECLNSSE